MTGREPPEAGAVPLVTVVVPVFDGEDELPSALESVMAQSSSRWEVVIVDDGSTDRSATVAESIAADDPRFRVLREPHAGASAARNAGIAAATTPWLLFLDADDELEPDALSVLLAGAAEHPDAGCVHAGVVRVVERDDGGPPALVERPARPASVAGIAVACPWAIHAAIVRTEDVRRAGGFDPSLATGEDWDLWVRVARMGVELRHRDAIVARYSTRPGTASAAGLGLLDDGLRVLERSHGPDPRVRSMPGWEEGAPSEELAAAQLAFAAYVVGAVVGRGGGAEGMFARVPADVRALRSALGAVAGGLHESVGLSLLGRGASWSALPQDVERELHAVLAELEARVPTAELQVRRALEERALTGPSDPGRFGRTQVVQVELTRPVDDVRLAEEGVDRLRVVPTWDGVALTGATIPVDDGLVPAVAVLDACVAPNAWELLEALLERSGVDVRGFATDGWPIFVRELRGRRPRRALAVERLLNRVGRRPSASSRPAVEATVDLAGLPRVLPVAPRTPVRLEVRAGGTPLWWQELPATAGRWRSGRIAGAVADHAGYELCRAVVARALLHGAPDRGIGLREALRTAPASPGGVSDVPLRVGRRAGSLPGSAAGRAGVLPGATAAEVAAAAGAGGDPFEEPAPGAPGPVVVDPTLLGPFAPTRPTTVQVERSEPPAESASSVRHAFETLFASGDDPWAYDSAYERVKYEQTLSLVPEGAATALELACAEGHFTPLLAGRVAHVEAVDISDVALERARARCAGLDNVDFHRSDFFSEPIPGEHDVVLCSEVLYYVGDHDRLRGVTRKIAGAVRPGGVLVTAHANAVADDPSAPGFDWDVPYGALGIEQAFLADGRLVLEHELRTDLYRVQRYRRVEPGSRQPAPVRERVAPAATLPEDVAARFRPEGGEVRRDDAALAPETWALPILMWHRVAPDGDPRQRRWRVTPEELDEQLAYLRASGHRSVTLAEWQGAVLAGRPLPGRAVALTFDDGFVDFEEHAMPLLERHGFRATLFVVGDLVGGTNAWDADVEPLPLMDWDALRRVRSSGHEVGAHTATHPRLTGLDDADVVRELVRSRRRVHDELGEAPRAYAAPYGLRDPGIDALAAGCGFEIGVGVGGGRAVPSSPPLALPRIEVAGGVTLRDFVALLA